MLPVRGIIQVFKDTNARYHCHTGHGFLQGALWSGIIETVETKLWQAMRSMEEGILF
jgi:two-component system chemotaxis response regulator CheB